MIFKYIVLLCLIIILLLFIYNSITEGFQSNTEHKFINLVLYSDNIIEYEEMKSITEKYYSTFNNVTTIYYKFDNNITSDYEMDNNILKIKGMEGGITKLTDKTIKAIEYIHNAKYYYDYLVRSNISTIINFKLLDEELKKKNIEYGGGNVYTLSWLDYPGGIIDTTYFGVKFVSGTSIIFSKKCVMNVLKNKDKLIKHIVDDVSIGIFMRDVLKISPINIQNGDQFVIVSNDSIKNNKKISKYIFYRHKNENNRKIDIDNMRHIVGII
jgi:hypothetical protein